MNLLEEREERYRKRKEAKKRHDAEINLSYNEDKKGLATLQSSSVKKLSTERIRLLDEGAVEDGNGRILFFIEKGTIEKFLNGGNKYLDNITDDFEGHVDLGHMDFATFPYIIGSWKREDLHLVDLENDRKGVDVDLHLDEESVFVKELARQPYDIGVSAEFYFHLDWEKMADFDYAFEVIDEIQIIGYGLVGECGNVNSDGLELKGGQGMTEDKNLAIEETVEETEQEAAEMESEEETVEDKKEEAVETEEVEGVGAEENEVEEVEDDDEDDVEEDEDEDEGENLALEALNEIIEGLKKEKETLEQENLALKKSNKKLKRKLAAKNEAIEAFASKFKGLSVNLGLTQEEEEKPEESAPKMYAGNDGIGE